MVDGLRGQEQFGKWSSNPFVVVESDSCEIINFLLSSDLNLIEISCFVYDECC